MINQEFSYKPDTQDLLAEFKLAMNELKLAMIEAEQVGNEDKYLLLMKDYLKLQAELPIKNVVKLAAWPCPYGCESESVPISIIKNNDIVTIKFVCPKCNKEDWPSTKYSQLLGILS